MIYDVIVYVRRRFHCTDTPRTFTDDVTCVCKLAVVGLCACVCAGLFVCVHVAEV